MTSDIIEPNNPESSPDPSWAESSLIEDQILIANARRVNFRMANLHRDHAVWHEGEREQFESELAASSTVLDRFGVFLRYLDKLESMDLASTTEGLDGIDHASQLSPDEVVSMIDPELFDELREQYLDLKEWLLRNGLVTQELRRDKSGLTIHFNDPEENYGDARVGMRNRPLLTFVIMDENGVPTEVTIAKRMTFVMCADDHVAIVGNRSVVGEVAEIEDLLDGKRSDAIILPVSTEYYVKAKPIEKTDRYVAIINFS